MAVGTSEYCSAEIANLQCFEAWSCIFSESMLWWPPPALALALPPTDMGRAAGAAKEEDEGGACGAEAGAGDGVGVWGMCAGGRLLELAGRAGPGAPNGPAEAGGCGGRKPPGAREEAGGGRCTAEGGAECPGPSKGDGAGAAAG